MMGYPMWKKAGNRRWDSISAYAFRARVTKEFLNIGLRFQPLKHPCEVVYRPPQPFPQGHAYIPAELAPGS